MNIKNFQNSFECVLAIKESISKPAFFLIPVCEPTIIKSLFGVFYNKRSYIKPKALFQGNQSADSAVSVLERVNIFEVCMKFNNIVDGYITLRIKTRNEFIHGFVDFARLASFPSSDSICSFFIISDGKPIKRRIFRSLF